MNIVLCGFMGCGKSTVGRRLAENTGFALVDTDSYIEQQAGMTVRDIFAAEGETVFRSREHEACVTLGKQNNLIIATGGGAVLREDNVTALRQNGTIVWLRVTPETVIDRLKDDATRPLLQREDKEQAVKELMTARTPLYSRAADVQIDADGDADAVCAAILAAVGIG